MSQFWLPTFTILTMAVGLNSLPARGSGDFESDSRGGNFNAMPTDAVSAQEVISVISESELGIGLGWVADALVGDHSTASELHLGVLDEKDAGSGGCTHLRQTVVRRWILIW